MTASAWPNRRGFSLIELLCVIAIIALLAGLLAGPVLRALAKVKNWESRDRAPIMVSKVADQLRRHYEGKQNYPASTLEDLRQRGVFDAETMRFLRSKNVEYFPFSSADPPEKLILSVTLSKREVQTLFKADLIPRAAD